MAKGKIAGYYRLSIEDDNGKVESNSITNQRLLIKKYIAGDQEFADYEFCEFYDDGFSGTTMNRPGIQSLLKAIKNDEIQVIVVKDISRFSRDYIELGTYMEQILPFLGIRFIAITDRYDSKDYIGRTANIDIGFKSLLADFYCKDISGKVKSSIAAKRNQGKYATGSTPFGYMKNPKNLNELVIIQEEAKVIRRIFNMSLSRMNFNEICKALNDESILTPLEFKNRRKKLKRKELEKQHKYWQAGTIRAILMNESYIGSMVYNKTEQEAVGSTRTVLKPRSEWKIYQNHHEAIIEEALFRKVQGNLIKRKESEKSPVEYLLKSKFYCGYCKRKLRVMKLAGEQLFFYCDNHKLNSQNACLPDKVSNEFVELLVLNEIKKQMKDLLELDVIKRIIIKESKATLSKAERSLEAVAKAISEVTEKKSHLLEGYHEGQYAKEQYKEGRNLLEDDLIALKATGQELEDSVSNCITQINDKSNDYEKLLAYNGFDNLTKEMVHAFVERIEISAEKVIDIYWTFNHQGKNCE